MLFMTRCYVTRGTRALQRTCSQVCAVECHGVYSFCTCTGAQDTCLVHAKPTTTYEHMYTHTCTLMRLKVQQQLWNHCWISKNLETSFPFTTKTTPLIWTITTMMTLYSNYVPFMLPTLQGRMRTAGLSQTLVKTSSTFLVRLVLYMFLVDSWFLWAQKSQSQVWVIWSGILDKGALDHIKDHSRSVGS